MKMNAVCNIPAFLPAMIADFPGSAWQKKQAEKAAMRFIEQHGPPPYDDLSTGLLFFAAVMKGGRK
jgi:hypothetical protein